MSFIIDPYRFGFTCPDADATAFVLAAGITDDTQKRAICTLVSDLKAYGLWTKMRAIYPFCGSTANQQKFNLKDPRDLDAAFRLVFFGGGTHSSTGWTPNGTNGYSNTFLTPSANLTNNSTHLSFYSRTNFNGSPGGDIGTSGPSPSFLPIALIYTRAADLFQSSMYDYDSAKRVSTSNTNSTGFYVGNRTSNVVLNTWKNGVKQGTNTTTETQNITTVTNPFFVGAINLGGSAGQYSNKECAFASIGDGLTDTEAANLYIAVQKYQTTLGRQVGVPIVTDPNAQAFLDAAQITNITEANAIDKLVIDLKAFGIWTKLRAIYPFCGSTASQQKFNLKDPRDLDAAFRLVFNGGWTHSSNGALPNGTNGFANTFYSPTAQTSITNTHASLYLRTGSVNPQIDFGSTDDVSYTNRYFMNYYYDSNSYFDLRSRLTIPNASIGGLLGHINMVRTATNLMKAYKNGNVVGTNTNSSLVYGLPSSNLYLSALNFFGTAISFQNRQIAFATFGDGITDTEAANLYTAIQTYQTSLNRQV